MFKVEMQRSRGGQKATGKKTRPYQFGQFQILAVSMYPSSDKDWGKFLYTVGDWLIPDPEDPTCIATFQPVPSAENVDWTEDINKCITWVLRGEQRTIGGGEVLPPKPKRRTRKRRATRKRNAGTRERGRR